MSRDLCVVIAGADIGQRGSIQHEDDFRYHVDGVLMSRPALKEYYGAGRAFRNRDRLAGLGQAAPRQQVYFVGLYLYSMLATHGFDVALINCFDPSTGELATVLEEDPLAVIVSTTFVTLREVEQIVKYVRARSPDVPVLIGGRWVWYSHRVLQAQGRGPYQIPDVRQRYFFTRQPPLPGITAYIVAEGGERTLLEVLGRIRSGDAWDDLPNLAFTEPDHIRFTQRRADEIDIEKLLIDWSIIPPELTSTVLPIALSLGCPFRCNFCNFSEGRYRRKTWEQVRQELRQLAEHQRFVASLWFIDDNVFMSPEQAEAFCRIMEEEDLPFSWRSFMRADVVTAENVDRFRRSKCEMMVLGLESMDDRVLEAMGKRARADQYRESIRLIAEAGISAELAFIVGFPPEDDRSIGRLCEFLANFPSPVDNAVYFLYLFLFHLAPLAPAFEEEFRRRYRLEGAHLDWKHATMDSDAARARIRQIYLAADSRNLFLNYLDCHPRRCGPRDREIMSKREMLAKAILAGSANHGRIEDELEGLIVGGTGEGQGR